MPVFCSPSGNCWGLDGVQAVQSVQSMWGNAVSASNWKDFIVTIAFKSGMLLLVKPPDFTIVIEILESIHMKICQT